MVFSLERISRDRCTRIQATWIQIVEKGIWTCKLEGCVPCNLQLISKMRVALFSSVFPSCLSVFHAIIKPLVDWRWQQCMNPWQNGYIGEHLEYRVLSPVKSWLSALSRLDRYFCYSYFKYIPEPVFMFLYACLFSVCFVLTRWQYCI